MPKISIIILTYNSSLFIPDLLDSIFTLIRKELVSGSIEIVIFDNSSTDDTQRVIKDYFFNKEDIFGIISETTSSQKQVRLIIGDENNGYAKGINLASKFARGEYLLVINPDSVLISCDFERVIKEFETHTRLAIVGFKIINYCNRPEKNAGSFYNPLTFLVFTLGLERFIHIRFSPKKRKFVDYISGGFVMFRTKIFDELNGYDEDYFMYVEDMDICYRARKVGYKVEFLPFALLQHKGQGSSSREFAIVNIYKGLSLFYKKHKSNINYFYARSLLSLKATLIIFLGQIFRKKDLISSYTKALKIIS